MFINYLARHHVIERIGNWSSKFIPVGAVLVEGEVVRDLFGPVSVVEHCPARHPRPRLVE